MNPHVRLIFALMAVTWLAGCGDTTPQAPPAAPLPPEYGVLAEQLSLGFHESLEECLHEKDQSEIMSECHTALLALENFQSHDPEITYVAAHARLAIKEIIARFERINALPKPPGAGEVFVESFLHGLYGNVLHGYELGVEAEGQQNAIVTEVRAFLAASDQLDAAQKLLPQIARKYAAASSPPEGRFGVDFTEAWGSFGPHDWLVIHYAGPEDLRHATVQVRLIGEAGQVRTNVHYVSHWPAGSWRHARYDPGEEILDRPDAFRTTVTRVQKVEVAVLSPTLSTEVAYEYEGAERDKDVAATCKELSFTGRYQPFVAGLLWDTARGAEITLDGVEFLPACRVEVVFRQGSQEKSWFWDFESWKRSETKSFSTPAGELRFDPSDVDLVISFPGVDYKHKSSIHFAR